MKPRTILIIVLAFFALAALLIWRNSVSVKRVPKKAVKIAAKKIPAKAKIAIVMDDFGYNMNNIEEFFSIGKPITLSILPNQPYSSRIANLAHLKGYEVILHLPLEPKSSDVRQEPGTISSKMSKAEITQKLKSELESVPYAKGVSNHMGSKATEEECVMNPVLSELRKRRLYFFDSLTTPKSVCEKTARAMGVRFAERDIFLDMGRSDADYVKKQMLSLKKLALKKGRAIAVCHDRAVTIKVLKEMMPKLSAEGIKFVYLSELVG